MNVTTISQPRNRVDLLVSLVRWSLAGMWLIASIAKATALDDFRRSLQASELVPSWFMAFAPIVVIAVELAFVALLISPLRSHRQLGCAGSAGTLAFFAAYHAWRGYRGIDAPCQCFGPILRVGPAAGGAIALLLATVSLTIWQAYRQEPV